MEKRIDHALGIACPAECNRAITLCHYELSIALSGVLGEDVGSNFHSWAVWGSKKAGVTIRQEDLEQARTDAMRVAGITGGLVGLGVARWLEKRDRKKTWYALGAAVGPVTGALCGSALAVWSRRKAARLVLEGNKLVLNDIGRVTAGFVTRFRSGIEPVALDEFCAALSDPLLSGAFRAYGEAALARNIELKHQACYLGNLLAILYEHKKLQPFIEGAMPLIVRRCVTKRMLTFDIGNRKLSVTEDVPSLDDGDFPKSLAVVSYPKLVDFLADWDRSADSVENSAANDWTQLPQRMSYIVDLFRRFHLDPNVTAEPVVG